MGALPPYEVFGTTDMSTNAMRMGALIVWGAFVAWCVAGYPPSLDLPAHAAQMQTLVELLRGVPEVTTRYEARFPIGYGLTTWLAVPIAWVFDGAVAARVVCWSAVALFPVMHHALRRSLGLPPALWSDLAAAALAFNVSYWFGFLPTLWALTATVGAWALFVHALGAQHHRARWHLALAAAATLVLLTHLLMVGPLLLGSAALALGVRAPRRAVVSALAALGVPLTVLGAARVVELLGRTRGEDPHAFQFDLPGHLNWVFRASPPLGQAEVTAAWVLVLACLASALVAWLRHRSPPRPAVTLFLAMLALYLLTPKAMALAWLLYPRLGVLLAGSALLLGDFSSAWARRALVVVALGGLALTGARHAAFIEPMRGLAHLVERPPPATGVHGGLSLVGDQLGSGRIQVLEHLPQWWTARHGGLGHHFFADADHQPVRSRPGQALPQQLTPDTPASTFAPFSALLIFGAGPLPAGLADFEVTATDGRWRRVDRARPPAP